MRLLVGTITEGPVRGLFAVAQEVGSRLGHHESDRAQCDLQMDVLVGAIAERLRFRFAAQAPRVLLVWKGINVRRSRKRVRDTSLTFYQIYFEGFLIIYYSIVLLLVAGLDVRELEMSGFKE